MIVLACTNCGREYQAQKRTNSQGEPRLFCSKVCYQASLRKGEAQPLVECTECGTSFWVSPYRLNRSKNLFCSRACKGRWTSKNLIGEQALAWKGGVKSISRWLHAHSQMKNWSRKVRQHANNICQRCGEPATQAHHLRHVEELLALIFDPANGEALCDSCHVAHHNPT